MAQNQNMRRSEAFQSFARLIKIFWAILIDVAIAFFNISTEENKKGEFYGNIQ